MNNDVKMNVYVPELRRNVSLELLHPDRLGEVNINLYFKGNEYSVQFAKTTVDGVENTRVVGLTDLSSSQDEYELMLYFLVSDKDYIELMEHFIFCVIRPSEGSEDKSYYFKEILEGFASAILDETNFLLNRMEA